uniref:Nodule cysteine-rich protein 2 n=1 Tax=Cicer arietinum TaxID=3827 RepID=A0A0U8T1H8_CICAR|nr:TPA_exp: nodule cysteine-rich protein 2 [Cicer arietinum]
MAQTQKFVYVIILFLSVCLVVTKVASRYCEYDMDCEDYVCTAPEVSMCIHTYCRCV